MEPLFMVDVVYSKTDRLEFVLSAPLFEKQRSQQKMVRVSIIGQALSILRRKFVYSVILIVQRNSFNRCSSSKSIFRGHVSSIFELLDMEYEYYWKTSATGQIRWTKNTNAINPPSFPRKIKKCRCVELQKIKEHVRLSASKKGLEMKNCTEESEEKELILRAEDSKFLKITAELNHAQIRA